MVHIFLIFLYKIRLLLFKVLSKLICNVSYIYDVQKIFDNPHQKKVWRFISFVIFRIVSVGVGGIHFQIYHNGAATRFSVSIHLFEIGISSFNFRWWTISLLYIYGLLLGRFSFVNVHSKGRKHECEQMIIDNSNFRIYIFFGIFVLLLDSLFLFWIHIFFLLKLKSFYRDL